MLSQQLLNTVQGFEPISLEEMDSVKLMNRVDTKFAFNIDDLDNVLKELQKDYRIFEIKGTRFPSYESLYFDDDDFTFYHDHHNGKMNRFKVRFRKYVESGLYFLEVKHKFKGRTNKKRIQVENFSHHFDEHQKNFLNQLILERKKLKSCLWNSFNRITLVHKEEKERLTLDFGVTFKWEQNEHRFDNLVIAELKQERVDRNSTFFEVMKKTGVRPYRLSKYCLGSIELHGTERIKYNRFKKKLLKLKQINDDAA